MKELTSPILLAVCGPEGAWKTTFGLTFPRPIVHFELDIGGFGRAAWRLDLTSIASKSYSLPIPMEKLMSSPQGAPTARFHRGVRGYKEIWQQFVIDFVAACQDPQVKTLILDSGTMLWTVCHTALLQEKQEVQQSEAKSKGRTLQDFELRERLQPIEYPNERMRSLIYTARSCKKNLVTTHYPKDIYADMPDPKSGDIKQYKTGKVDMDGFKETRKYVDAEVWMSITATGQVTAKFTEKCAIPGLGTNALGLIIDPPGYEGIVKLKEAMNGGA